MMREYFSKARVTSSKEVEPSVSNAQPASQFVSGTFPARPPLSAGAPFPGAPHNSETTASQFVSGTFPARPPLSSVGQSLASLHKSEVTPSQFVSGTFAASPPLSAGGPPLGSLHNSEMIASEVYAKTNLGEMSTHSHLADRLVTQANRKVQCGFLDNAARADNFNNFSQMLNPTQDMLVSEMLEPTISKPRPTVTEEILMLPSDVETREEVMFEILDRFVEGPKERSGPKISKEEYDLYRQRWMTRLASASDTPSGVMRRLCNEGDEQVRRALAENSNAPIDVIWKLVKDESDIVRCALAQNHNVGIEVLDALNEDENATIADTAWTTLKQIQLGLTQQFRKS